MAKNERRYSGKDIDMLTVLLTILTNAGGEQARLEEKRTNLTPGYINGLEKKLDDITKKYFGVDSAKQLRQQTIIVYGIEDSAYKAVSVMNDQLKASYNSDKTTLKELQRHLGFAEFFKGAGNSDTEALISLLYQYQQNMTPQLQEQLAATGIPATDITLPVSFAVTLRDANVSQESFKSIRKTITAEAVAAYNDIYTEVTGKIGKLARVFFPGDPAKQAMFSYTGLLKALNRQKPKSDETPA